LPKQGIIYDWKFLGAVLANDDESVQADFFKAFIKEINTWGTRMQREMQLIWVNKRLTDEEKELLACLSFKE
jgi:hypothetical protein